MQKKANQLILSLAFGLLLLVLSNSIVKADSDPYYINDTVSVNHNVNQVRKIYPNYKIGSNVPLKLKSGTKLTVMSTDQNYYLFANLTRPEPYVYGIPFNDANGSYAQEIAKDDQDIERHQYIYHPTYQKQYRNYQNGSRGRYAKLTGSIRYQTLKSLNRDRRKYRLSPLSEDRFDLDKIASLRAKQIYKRQSHYNRRGQAMALVNAKKLKLSTYSNGEAEGENFSVDHLHKHDTGFKVANRTNNVFMNHDWKPFGHLERNGHRKNILRPQFKAVGIGVYIRNRNVIITEDFESD